MRATKLICTLGPASAGRVREMVAAGMDVARINLSHGTREEHEGLLHAVRDAAREAGRAVGVLADLSGPKVRLGELAGGEVLLEEGARFTLRRDDGSPGDGREASVNYAGLAGDLRPGDRVLLADGAAELRVVEQGDGVVTEVVLGGTVRSRAGVNVPSERLSLPAITEKDEKDLAWAIDAEVDLVAQSFVRRAADVLELRRLVGEEGPLLVAKIETRAAVEDARRILDAADAAIVARGDLGVETALEEIPVIQKRLVALANDAAVPVIIATQMLESMIHHPLPTRAEASDTAGAVFEGADAVLLSAETAIGEYPVETVRTAARILDVAEYRGASFLPRPREMEDVASGEVGLARAAALVAARDRAVAVACYTVSGMTARLLSAARPPVPIFAFSHEPRTVGRLPMFRGVVPFLADRPESTDEMIAMMDRRLRGARLAGPGELVVMVASSPAGQADANLLKLHEIGT